MTDDVSTQSSRIEWTDSAPASAPTSSSEKTFLKPPSMSNHGAEHEKKETRHIPRSDESLERIKAAYDDHGRHHFASEQLAAIEQDDPFKYCFEAVDVVQEYAVPLISGAVIALVWANISPSTYEYLFASCRTIPEDDGHDDHHRRRELSGVETCGKHRYLLSDCDWFDHALTLHFVANDIVMCFHFALAMKEVTEALLPGGSVNPPSKAINPIMVTFGCVAGPIAAYFALLALFDKLNFFDSEYERGVTWDDLVNGKYCQLERSPPIFYRLPLCDHVTNQ